MDFIFHVDLTTTYIILRRDFSTPQDVTGHLSSPLGAGFYYSAACANEVARAHCNEEASRGLSFMGEGVVHRDKAGLYVGGCVTREVGRDRFEVRVKRLRARGSWTGSGGREAASGGSRGGGLAVVEEEEDEGDGRERERSETPTSSLRESAGRRVGRLWSRIKKETRRGR